VADDDGLKVCRKCLKAKGPKAFHNDASRPDGKYPWCRACRSKAIKVTRGGEKGGAYVTGDDSRLCKWCEVGIGGTHPNRQYCSTSCKSKARQAGVYGLSVEQYKELIDSTGGKCPICRQKPTRWNIDHNHKTGESYGAVCVRCNTTVIAFSYHEVELARNLLEYLENPPIRKMFGPTFVTNRKLSQVDYSKEYNQNPGLWVLKDKRKRRRKRRKK